MFPDVCCNRFLSGCCICFQTYVATYVPNVYVVSVLCCSKCFFMLQLFYLDVAYVSHTCCKAYVLNVLSVSNICYSKCFMWQVQTANVGVHEGGQSQAIATDTWRRRRPSPAVWGGGTGRAVLLWKRRGRVFQAAWKRRTPRRCGRGGGESSEQRGQRI